MPLLHFEGTTDERPILPPSPAAAQFSLVVVRAGIARIATTRPLASRTDHRSTPTLRRRASTLLLPFRRAIISGVRLWWRVVVLAPLSISKVASD
jgi:hypothetical protein